MPNVALDILVNVAKTKILLIFISFSSLVFIFVLVLLTIIQNVFVIFVVVDEKHCTSSADTSGCACVGGGGCPHKKNCPRGGAVARVFPNVSLALCPQKTLFGPLLVRLWSQCSTQCHNKWHHSITRIRVAISRHSSTVTTVAHDPI